MSDSDKSSGLGDLSNLGSLSSLLDQDQEQNQAGTAGPLDLSIDLIDEDPDQPRKEDNPGFSTASLEELAATISERGVKSPISVRDNPDVPGRYIINHGARRFRASVLAGKQTVPGFIDNDYNEADQVIENLQRNELTAREIADYIGRELAKGKKKGEVAKEIGKSNAFVSQHVTLLDLPDIIADAFNSGRIKDVTVVNELVTAHKKNPDDVQAWLADDSQEFTRGTVKLLREYLDEKKERDRDPDTIDAFTGQTDNESADDEPAPKEKKEPKEIDPEKIKKAIVLVTHDERMARLMTNKRPPAEGWAWLKYEDDGDEIEVDLGSVKLVALMEG